MNSFSFKRRYYKAIFLIQLMWHFMFYQLKTRSKESSILVVTLKGVIGCCIYFYKLFELKCVLAVFVSNHPIMIKIHLDLFFFLISLKNFPFLKSSQSQMPVCVTSQKQAPPTIVWLAVVFQHRLDSCHTLVPPWMTVISPPLLDWQFNLSCWRRSGLPLFLKVMCPWST